MRNLLLLILKIAFEIKFTIKEIILEIKIKNLKSQHLTHFCHYLLSQTFKYTLAVISLSCFANNVFPRH